jgi:hypothetical protein
MADINAVDLAQETALTLDGAEQFVMFDTSQGKRSTVEEVGNYILNRQKAIGTKTVSEHFDSVDQEVSEIRASVGTPLVANTAIEMTDRTKIYVYTGSESGYSNGHWYYWNGSSWEDGGVYQATAIQTDKTLLLSDQPADAKTVGDILRSITATDTTGEGDIVLSFGM